MSTLRTTLIATLTLALTAPMGLAQSPTARDHAARPATTARQNAANRPATTARGQDARPAVTARGNAAQDAGAADAPKLEYVKMETSLGEIILELNREKAPATVDNFLAYVDKKFYDETIFHRVISNFMIQGGGFTANMQKKPTDEPIKNEWDNGLKNRRGTIAMARLPGKADSATSQFFINVNDNQALDQPRDGAGYAVFGKVVAGMETVERIRRVPVTRSPSGEMSVPKEVVLIKRVRRLDPAEADKIRKDEKENPKPDRDGDGVGG